MHDKTQDLKEVVILINKYQSVFLVICQIKEKSSEIITLHNNDRDFMFSSIILK